MITPGRLLISITGIPLIGLFLVLTAGKSSTSAGSKVEKVPTESRSYITIKEAICVADHATNLTGIYVTGTTNENIADLMGSAYVGDVQITQPGEGMGNCKFQISSNNGNFVYNPLLAHTAKIELCPTTVVIMAKDDISTTANVISIAYPCNLNGTTCIDSLQPLK